MAGGKTKLKIITTFSAIITLVSFLYKATLGVLTMSMVLMVASISTLLVFICKVIFIKNVTKSRESKKKAYLFMALAIFFFTLLFLLFAVLKVNGIDTSNQKTYSGVFGSLFILFIIIMLVLNALKLKGALQKNDIMVIGLKEMIFASALTDIVIIEEFAYRIGANYKEIPEWMSTFHSFVPLGVAAVMFIIPIVMLIRFAKYKA